MNGLVVNLDTAVNLTLIVRKNHSMHIDIEFTDAAGSPVTLTGTYKMAVSKDKISPPLFTLVSGNGLTIASNKLTINKSAVGDNIPAGNYVYDIRVDYSDGTSACLFEGLFQVNQNITAL